VQALRRVADRAVDRAVDAGFNRRHPLSARPRPRGTEPEHGVERWVAIRSAGESLICCSREALTHPLETGTAVVEECRNGRRCLRCQSSRGVRPPHRVEGGSPSGGVQSAFSQRRPGELSRAPANESESRRRAEAPSYVGNSRRRTWPWAHPQPSVECPGRPAADGMSSDGEAERSPAPW
jgi:hypothetical protein